MISGYTTIINKYAKHPNAAKLAREYIFSDAGQINLAKGNARPIRAESLTLPDDVKAQLLPNEQYAKAQPIKDAKAWEETSAPAAAVAGSGDHQHAVTRSAAALAGGRPASTDTPNAPRRHPSSCWTASTTASPATAWGISRPSAAPAAASRTAWNASCLRCPDRSTNASSPECRRSIAASCTTTWSA